MIFFVASPAASSAYLTVSEIFPLETRALAIAFFFSLGTGAGGIVAPWLFGSLIGTGSAWSLFYGYVAAAVLMIAAGIIEIAVRRRGRAAVAGKDRRAAVVTLAAVIPGREQKRADRNPYAAVELQFAKPRPLLLRSMDFGFAPPARPGMTEDETIRAIDLRAVHLAFAALLCDD